MGRPLYKKDKYIITEAGGRNKYYTVVDISTKGKIHTHLNTFKQAKLVIHWAIKGRVPNKYNNYMKNSIRRLRPDLIEGGKNV